MSYTVSEGPYSAHVAFSGFDCIHKSLKCHSFAHDVLSRER
jgi:hypothetical protein